MDIGKMLTGLYRLADESPNIGTLTKASVLLDRIERSRPEIKSDLGPIRAKFESLCGVDGLDELERAKRLDSVRKEIRADITALRKTLD